MSECACVCVGWGCMWRASVESCAIINLNLNAKWNAMQRQKERKRQRQKGRKEGKSKGTSLSSERALCIGFASSGNCHLVVAIG